MLLRYVRFLAAWLALLAALSSGVPAQQEAAQSPAPELALSDLAGRRRGLGDYRGRIVVLNFWATWCVPCRTEMPVLSSLQKRYAARGVIVIGASADDESTRGQVAPFVREAKIDFPVWVGATTDDMQRFGLGTALPATAVIDRDGRIAGRIVGPVDAGDVERHVEFLLGGRSGPAPPAFVDNIRRHAHHDGEPRGGEEGHSDEDGHHHAGEEEEHQHGGVGIEGASTVPS